jgi:hypothetical protein
MYYTVNFYFEVCIQYIRQNLTQFGSTHNLWVLRVHVVHCKALVPSRINIITLLGSYRKYFWLQASFCFNALCRVL